MNITIVIPTYNEKDTLPGLIAKLTSEVKRIAEKFSIIIMDDASPDGTGKIAEDLNKKYKNITVVKRPSKLGLGSAYKQGFQIALDRFDSDYVVQMDADHSHDPKEISLMADKIIDHDYVVASRHLPGSSIIGWGSGRKLLHSMAGKFSEIKSEGFAFQVELLCYLRRKGLHGIEIPTIFVNRKLGKSKMNLREIIQFSKMCINLLRNRI